MQAIADTALVLNHPEPDVSGGAAGTQASPTAAIIESAQLLQGHKAVGILHNGSLYRLQATKLGKLILTK